MIGLVSDALLWVGALTVLIGSAGLLRFPDFFTRTHAATVVSVGGFTLSLAGIALISPNGIQIAKIILIILVNLMVNPTGTHALADSAYSLGIRPLKLSRNDLEKGGRK